MSGRRVQAGKTACIVLLCAFALSACAETASPPTPRAKQESAALNPVPPEPISEEKHPSPAKHSSIDRSGRVETGKASYYARKFDGRRMADGRVFNPRAAVAASKTLPLGTTAKVVNLKTGRSAVVTVQDRGPHVDGRVIDVSPHVATQLKLHRSGVAPVLVKPIAVPQPGGTVKLGAGAAGLPPRQLAEEVRKTKALTQEAGH